MRLRSLGLSALGLLLVAFVIDACADEHGGAVSGPIDAHCGATANPTSAAACTASADQSGAIRFDRAGYWTVRFHVFDACVDGPLSPHSHVAFYVNAP